MATSSELPHDIGEGGSRVKGAFASIRLLLDLDGTTLRNAGREVISRIFDLPLPDANTPGWLSSGILEERGITKEQFWAAWQANEPEIYGRAIPLPGALETLAELKAGGAHIAVVTARRGSAETVTQEWLARYAVPYDAIQFNCDDKLAVAQSLGLNLAIEDDLAHVMHIAQAMPVMLMDSDGRHADAELPAGVHKVAGWHEVPGLIARIQASLVLGA